MGHRLNEALVIILLLVLKWGLNEKILFLVYIPDVGLADDAYRACSDAYTTLPWLQA